MDKTLDRAWLLMRSNRFEAIELDSECPDYYASLSKLYWMRGYARNLHSRKKKEFAEEGVKSAQTSLEIDPQQSLY